ncbi:RNA helicase [Enterococcus sp. JM4C]|uniref:DEAD/DEAH box helicase n=1 Tax=Candidatus Enterococcus huntleyi TaxID=1857217 RepID=UPI00137AA307|nr:DEAD/DEAH box helicase [Enterococcus sp. JM4C]KAF1297164.1 RNA helicase [Enterococcus sp. JM4C]
MSDYQVQLPEVWQKKWQGAGFTAATAIQTRCFAPLSEKEDVVGISPTGSGKTLAYLLPLLLKVEQGQANQLLILTSSQELAIQVTEVARQWAQEIGLKVQPLIGGANVKRQLEKLKAKPEVIVGTPGRVLELMKQKKVKAHLFQTIVMDEADQLFQEGTENLTKQILKQAPVDYQLAFFSATADRALETIKTLKESSFNVIDVTEEDDSQGEVQHVYLRITERKKVDSLRRLAYLDNFQALVFFNQVGDMGAAEEKLLHHGVEVASLASDQSKLMRKMAIQQFREGKLSELLTTDIAARGLDIPQLPYIVNADIPMTQEGYIHRSGRVGRMGTPGVVLNLVSPGTIDDLKRLAKTMGIPLSEVFLHGGQLHTERPVMDDAARELHTKSIKKEKKPVKATHNFSESPQIKKKKKQKNQKNKGARRK